jgi:hypothetical protein
MTGNVQWTKAGTKPALTAHVKPSCDVGNVGGTFETKASLDNVRNNCKETCKTCEGNAEGAAEEAAEEDAAAAGEAAAEEEAGPDDGSSGAADSRATCADMNGGITFHLCVLTLMIFCVSTLSFQLYLHDFLFRIKVNCRSKKQ